MKLGEILKKPLNETAGGKRGRDVFMYMEPRQPADQFAQCGTCRLYVDGQKRCAILGPNVDVTADDSCGAYMHGQPHEQPIKASATPEEVGFVRHQVRCENCVSADNGKCRLFEKLNTTFPEIFDLDVNIDPKACCNAQMPK